MISSVNREIYQQPTVLIDSVLMCYHTGMKKSMSDLPLPRILALDLDGTLLRSDGTVSPRTVRALRRLEQMGCSPVICTGRNFGGVVRIVEQLGLNSPVISSNGAMIYSTAENRVIYERLLPDTVSRAIINEAHERNIYFQGFSHTDIYYEYQGDESRFYEKITGLKGTVTNFDSWKEFKFVKALMIGPPHRSPARWPELYEVQHKMKELYGDTLYAVFSRPFYLDFMSGESSKGKALDWLCGELDISRENTASMGDALNDVDMLKFTGTSIAMKNAPDEVKEICSLVTDRSNNEDGVADFIEREYLTGEEYN